MKNDKEKNKIKSELKEIAPKLAAIEKADPFRVDEQYFDKLPVEVLLKIQEVEHPDQWKKSLGFILKPKFAFPALAGAALILIAFFIFNRPNSVIGLPLADYSLEDVLAENPDIFEDIDETVLIETLFADNESDVSAYFGLTIDSTFSSQDLNDFLSDDYIIPEIMNEY
jgi:hypothetical protein